VWKRTAVIVLKIFDTIVKNLVSGVIGICAICSIRRGYIILTFCRILLLVPGIHRTCSKHGEMDMHKNI
jgi:hypothetical protein